MARHKKRTEITGWGEFILEPIGVPNGTPVDQWQVVRLIRGPVEDGEPTWSTEEWPLRVILANLGCFAAETWTLIDESDRIACTAEVEEWINQTRSIASRFPFGGPYVDEMRRVADRVETISRTLSRYADFGDRQPGSDRETNFRFNTAVFALDEIRKASGLLRETFWDDWLGRLLPADRLASQHPEATFDPVTLGKRSDRYVKKLKPKQREHVVADALRDVVRYGPVLADGSRRPGLKVRPEKYPAQAPK